VRQQFKAVLPMVESMLAGLKSVDGLKGALSGEIWDQGDGAPPPHPPLLPLGARGGARQTGDVSQPSRPLSVFP